MFDVLVLEISVLEVRMLGACDPCGLLSTPEVCGFSGLVPRTTGPGSPALEPPRGGIPIGTIGGARMIPPAPMVAGLVTVVWLLSVPVSRYCVVSTVAEARFESDVIVAYALTAEEGILFFIVCSLETTAFVEDE